MIHRPHLDELIRRGNALFISHYTNFNILLGLYIAQFFANHAHTAIYVLSDHSIRTDLFENLSPNTLSHIKFVAYVDPSTKMGIVMAFLNYIDNDLYSAINSASSSFYIFTSKANIRKVRNTLYSYNIRKVEETLYSILSSNELLLVKVNRNNIEVVDIPEEIVNLYREMLELIDSYKLRSIKSNTVIKYLSQKYGYSREKCLEVLRRAIAMGIVVYSHGYLTIRQELEKDSIL